jgi:CNT family concentrative nucleoside transporter
MGTSNLVSLGGLFGLMGLAWLCSTDRRRVNWRVIVWGTLLQLVFGAFVFLFPGGSRIFLAVNDLVVKVIGAAGAGAQFVFGKLAVASGDPNLGFILAFQALPTIVFFSALMSLLYHVGVMSRVVRGFAWVFTRLMRVSGAESLCTASNIFVGIESALTVKPYLAQMTRSELCTILTAGMATIASSVLAAYVSFLEPQFKAIAGHLISASILSAPAALVMSKLLFPEQGTPVTLGRSVEPYYPKEGGVFEAIISGANDGVRLVVGIVALLLAVLGLMAVADLFLVWAGGGINGALGIGMDWSLKGLLGYLFYPLTVMMGVPVSDAGTISRIIGERAIVTELVSYQDLAAAIQQGLVGQRSAIIATYALCGFAHVASMAIFVGGISALAPSQTRNLASLGFRALWAATLACLMTACVAGMCYTGQSILFSGSSAL